MRLCRGLALARIQCCSPAARRIPGGACNAAVPSESRGACVAGRRRYIAVHCCEAGGAGQNEPCRSRPTPEQIQANIQRTVQRRSRPFRWRCPACQANLATAQNLKLHVQRCCPDLFDLAQLEQAVAGGDGDAADGPLDSQVRHAEERQVAMQREALVAAFLSEVDEETGEPVKHGPATVAVKLGLPLDRARQLLKTAQKAIPLVVDNDAVEVVFEDDDFIALNKPAGVNSQPIHRWQGGSMVNRVMGHLGYPPYGLHRLDQNTSGLLLMAKNPRVVPGVHEQFRQRSLSKSYLCIAMGRPPQQFSVDAPISRHPELEIARCVHSDGRTSQTSFSMLESAACDLRAGGSSPGRLLHEYDEEAGRDSRWSWASLVEARPTTGRTHQIRVHAAHAGHPLLGDEVYGLQGPWIARQSLHAYSMEITHPLSHTKMKFEAPLPADFSLALSFLGITAPSGICVP